MSEQQTALRILERCGLHPTDHQNLIREIVAIQAASNAEIERLREALENVVYVLNERNNPILEQWRRYTLADEYAQAALKGGTSPNPEIERLRSTLRDVGVVLDATLNPELDDAYRVQLARKIVAEGGKA